MNAPKQIEPGKSETDRAYEAMGFKNLGDVADFWLMVMQTPDTKEIKQPPVPTQSVGCVVFIVALIIVGAAKVLLG